MGFIIEFSYLLSMPPPQFPGSHCSWSFPPPPAPPSCHMCSLLSSFEISFPKVIFPLSSFTAYSCLYMYMHA